MPISQTETIQSHYLSAYKWARSGCPSTPKRSIKPARKDNDNLFVYGTKMRKVSENEERE